MPFFVKYMQKLNTKRNKNIKTKLQMFDSLVPGVH